jgi:hypothetical protein
VRCRLQDCTPLLKCLVEVHCRQDLDSAPTVLQRVKGRQGPPTQARPSRRRFVLAGGNEVDSPG